MPPQIPKPQTLTIDNFSARLTRYINGDLNSGYAKQGTTFGVNMFQQPKNLMFMEQQTSIGGAVVTDLIVAMKVRLESSITYVYAIGSAGRLYKIQVNDLATFNPNYDTPVLITTLANGQTFKYGGSIDFYGSTERIWIGCDQGVTRINFDGTSETVIGTTDSTHWIANVPRQNQQYNGKIYYTNNSNIAEIDSSETVTSYTKISPGFPTNFQSRDIDTTYDGRYLVITTTRAPLLDITTTTADTSATSSTNSLLVYWNGTDTAASSASTISSFEMTNYVTFGNNEYSFGYDISGSILSNPLDKQLSITGAQSPMPNAASSNGNLVGWCTPEFNAGFLNATLFLYGSLDGEVPVGFYRQTRFASALSNGDILKVPATMLVQNFTFAGATSGYNAIVGFGKIYISTLEFNGSSTAYKLYRFFNVPAGVSSSVLGVYETQTQLFSKKQRISEIRFYCEPLVSTNSLTAEIIGIDGAVISGTSKTFTISASTDFSVGSDVFKYSPDHKPTAAIGLRITNAGTTTPIIHKVEIDIVPAGR